MITILDEIKINENLEIKYLQSSARDNNIDSKMELAKRLIIGSGVKKSYETAQVLLEDVALEDNGEANYILGRLYLEGILKDESRKKGIERIENSSAKHYEKSTLFLAFSTLNGVNGIEKNINIADKSLRSLALSDNHESQFELGKLYETGIIGEVEIDITESLRWYELAAKGGVHESFYRLGYIFYHGSEETKISYKKAISFWEECYKINPTDELSTSIALAYAKHALSILEGIDNPSEIDKKSKRILSEL